MEDAGGPHRLGQRLPGLPGFRAGDVVDAHGAQGGDAQRADGSGSQHEHSLTWFHATLVDAVEGDGKGLGERRCPR